jgi:hypothetical protein
MFFWNSPAQAAAQAEVSIQGDALAAGSTSWKASCKIQGGVSITNGKVRVTYDGSKMKLTSINVGELLGGTLTNINDPLTGSKEEGEILLVFASADSFSADGTLLELEFQVDGQVKEGDELNISVSTEELKCDQTTVPVQDNGLQLVVGGSVQTIAGSVSETESGNSTKDGRVSENSSTTESGNISGSGVESTEISPGDTSKASTEAGNGDNTGSGKTASVTPVKTGDNTKILVPSLTALLAGSIALGIILKKRKERKA